jgi:hypothetical protein
MTALGFFAENSRRKRYNAAAKTVLGGHASPEKKENSR